MDEEIRRVLFATGKFETTSRSMDEDEHSIEMHLPYIAKVSNSSSSSSTNSISSRGDSSNSKVVVLERHLHFRVSSSSSSISSRSDIVCNVHTCRIYVIVYKVSLGVFPY